MKKLVITETSFAEFSAEVSVAAANGFDLHHASKDGDLRAQCLGASVVMVQFTKITADILSALAPGALIVRYGIGLDNIDLAAARAQGVSVAYVPDYATGEVADHAAALGIAALRKLPALDASVRSGRWDPVGVASPMPSFSTSTLGLLGFGRIAREVGRRFRAFGFSVIAHDPYVDVQEFQSNGVDSVDIESLFERSDCLSLHAPLSEATRHVVNRTRLAQMKPTAVIVNTSRGGLIDPDALSDALNLGQIASAGLDVFELEPLPDDSPLRNARNLILSPHVAWFSDTSARRVQELAADEVRRYAEGLPPRRPAQL